MPLQDPAAHKAYCKAYRDTHRDTHREEIRAHSKAHYQANKPTYQARHKSYRQKHQAAITATRQRHDALYAPQIAAKHHAYYLAHMAEIKARTAANRRAKPEQHAASNQRRRAQKRASGINTISGAQWREIKDAYGHCCVYCGRKMQRLTMDHIVPLSKGGTNTASNIVPACMSCNSSKKAGPPPVPVQPLLFTIAKPYKKKAS
jgi:5-methylcytosine-specific restriction endonuclease McrA